MMADAIRTGLPANRRMSRAVWVGIAMLTALGCLGIYPELVLLWSCWTTDPLRSIGMLIPPASIALTLRVWRQSGWQLRGAWRGLLLIAAAFVLSQLRRNIVLIAVAGRAMVSFVPVALPLYVYGSGVVLLFAGTCVWRKAWFPLGLLLLSQPVPGMANGLIDIPLQNISAQVARSFATLIGFAPTTPQLRLMFSPDFGMFIAPGCDGIRGAVAMGYLALILGYLKRVSLRRWVTYVVGAVLLGYLFNFIRLCILVLYYRVAFGHSALENMAKQADYAIGSCLFLLAIFLFLAVVRRHYDPAPAEAAPHGDLPQPHVKDILVKCTAFLVLVFVSFSLPSSALQYHMQSEPDPALLAERLPKQVGNFALTRTWYEQQNGTPVIEEGAYSQAGSDEITLGVWIAPFFHLHDPEQCWLARGLRPALLAAQTFQTASGEPLALNTGLYSDGIVDSIVVNVFCTSDSCSQFQGVAGKRLGFVVLKPQKNEFTGVTQHPVSIMVRIDRLHSGKAGRETYQLLSDELRRFVANLDLRGLARDFQ